MLIYEIFTYSFIILALFKIFKNNKYLLWAGVIGLIIVAAIRDYGVGTDTLSYYFSFSGKELDEAVYRSQKGEYLFYFIGDFCQKYLNFDWYMFIIYGLSYSCIGWAVNKASANKMLSLFMLIALNFFTGSFNLMRQFICMSIMLMAACFLDRNRDKKGLFVFLLLFVASYFIHHSVILCLLFLPFFFLRVSHIIWYAIISISFVLGVIFSSYLSGLFSFLGNIAGGYENYVGMVGDEGSRNIFSNLGLNLVALSTVFLYNRQDNINSIYVKLFAVAVIFQNLFGWGYFSRVAEYFALFQIITIPIAFEKEKTIRYKYLYFALILVYCFTKFYLMVPNTNQVVPYRTRW